MLSGEPSTTCSGSSECSSGEVNRRSVSTAWTRMSSITLTRPPHRAACLTLTDSPAVPSAHDCCEPKVILALQASPNPPQAQSNHLNSKQLSFYLLHAPTTSKVNRVFEWPTIHARSEGDVSDAHVDPRWRHEDVIRCERRVWSEAVVCTHRMDVMERGTHARQPHLHQ